MTGALDPVSSRYAHALRGVLLSELGEELVGVYLYGSAATGPYLHGQSDVDLLVVVRGRLGAERVRRLLDRVRAVARPSAVKGLDMWVVPLESTREPRADPTFECWLLTAIDRELIGTDGEPGDARIVLLYAMCRDHGVALAGPPPRRVFGPVRRGWIADAMRVDLTLPGPAGWYRVLNACRTLHFLEVGSLCGKLTGAAWARTRVADPVLIDAAVAWRRLGAGPPLPPDEVDAFVNAIAARLDGSPAAVPEAVPSAVEIDARDTVVADAGLVTCVLVAPRHAELLILAAKRFAEQDWENRELVILSPHRGEDGAGLPDDGRIRTVGIAPEEAGLWRELALRHARGAVLAAWDAATWYSRDRLTQQMLELFSTSTPRLVAPSLLAYDPSRGAARRLHEPELLERSTLCARRHAWSATGSATRLGERPGIAVVVEPGAAERGDRASMAEVRALVGEELDVYGVAVPGAAAPAARQPPVSCLMPTYNRRRFARRAIELFLEQDYPDRELVIVDDGEDPVADLVPAGAPVRYHRLPARETIGRKRQIACELADGELLVQWDDDDWYGPSRLRRQVAPLNAGNAEIAGILRGYLLDLATMRFWKGALPLHEGHVHALIVAGTLAYSRSSWRESGGYPDRSIGEEVALLQAVIDRGGRVAPILSDGIYVCVRHGANSWRLWFSSEEGPPGWAAVAPPTFLRPADLTFYRSLSEDARAA